MYIILLQTRVLSPVVLWLTSSFLLQIALESISVGLNFKVFLGEHAPRPP